MIKALILAAALTAAPVQQVPTIDFDTAIEIAVAEVIEEAPLTLTNSQSSNLKKSFYFATAVIVAVLVLIALEDS